MKLINGECLEELKKIEDKSVDCFICDLPYGTTICKWDNKIDLDLLWKEMKRTARNDKTPFFFFCDFRFAIQIYNSNQKWYRYDLVWYKPNSRCGHLHSGKMPMRSHELLLVFYKKLPTYNKNEYHKKITEKEEYDYSNKGEYNGVYDAKLNTNFKFGKKYDVPLPISVLTIRNDSNMSKRLHPTQKPQGILEWIIKYYSNKGDTILDPTMGSGSTGIACKTLNRNFIGIELDKDIFETAKERITRFSL